MSNYIIGVKDVFKENDEYYDYIDAGKVSVDIVEDDTYIFTITGSKFQKWWKSKLLWFLKKKKHMFPYIKYRHAVTFHKYVVDSYDVYRCIAEHMNKLRSFYTFDDCYLIVSPKIFHSLHDQLGSMGVFSFVDYMPDLRKYDSFTRSVERVFSGNVEIKVVPWFDGFLVVPKNE